MSEYREALARMTLAIQTNPMVLSDAVIATEYHAAKALLARGEPEQVDSLYQLLVVRGYAQHEAFAIAHGPPLSIEPAAAEKALEPMHEGFPVDTIVRDIFTDKVGTIVSYHCRFEVEWADGSNSMDVHSRQLDHCGPQPSPPAATGEK